MIFSQSGITDSLYHQPSSVCFRSLFKDHPPPPPRRKYFMNAPRCWWCKFHASIFFGSRFITSLVCRELGQRSLIFPQSLTNKPLKLNNDLLCFSVNGQISRKQRNQDKFLEWVHSVFPIYSYIQSSKFKMEKQI